MHFKIWSIEGFIFCWQRFSSFPGWQTENNVSPKRIIFNHFKLPMNSFHSKIGDIWHTPKIVLWVLLCRVNLHKAPWIHAISYCFILLHVLYINKQQKRQPRNCSTTAVLWMCDTDPNLRRILLPDVFFTTSMLLCLFLCIELCLK